MDIYEAMALRRDTRHFLKGVDVPDAVLQKIVHAASLAPSVGLSRPGRFVWVKENETKEKIQRLFLDGREHAEGKLDENKQEDKSKLHRDLKLEAILDTPIGLLVFCEYPKEYVLGASEMPKALEHSVACAIQNIWLALTAEQYGMGWVSFFDPEKIQEILEKPVPANWSPMGYLCIGKPATDYEGQPMLENLGWKDNKKAQFLNENLEPLG